MAHRRRHEAGRLIPAQDVEEQEHGEGIENLMGDGQNGDDLQEEEADLPPAGEQDQANGIALLIERQLQLFENANKPVISRGESKIPKYSELINMREYLFMFRTVIAQRGWSDNEAAIQLCSYLTGPAQAAAFRLTEYGYTHMEIQLLRQFTIDEADAQDKPKNFKKTKNMTFRQTADEIRELFKAIYAEDNEDISDARLNKEEIVAFRDAVDWHALNINLWYNKPANLTEAVKMAEIFTGFVDRGRASQRAELREMKFKNPEQEEPDNSRDGGKIPTSGKFDHETTKT